MRAQLAALSAQLVILGMNSTVALADVTPIPVREGQPFKHKPSGIIVPAETTGLTRGPVQEYDDKQLDVIVDFESPDKGEVTTIYLFRNVTGDVPVWFDRIDDVIAKSDRFGKVTQVVPPTAFTPAGQSGARGMHAAYAAAGTGWTSTGAALTQTGEWYVGIRASSKLLTAEQLLARMDSTFASLKWPKEKFAAPAAYRLADCAKPLAQANDAEPVVEDTGTLALVSALTGAISKDVKAAVSPEPATWCREPAHIPNAGVYRPDGADDRFLIAYQDAGRGVWVAPNGLAGILAGASSNGDLNYSVEFITMDRRIGFGSFKTLPTIAQALWQATHGSELYSTGTWGKSTNIELNSNAIK